MKNRNEENRDIMGLEEDIGLFDPLFEELFNFPHIPVPHVPGFRREVRDMERMAMRTDVKESDTAFELDVEMPGFEKKDISLDLNDGYLQISASHSSSNEEKDDKGNYIRRERCMGTCSRSFFVGKDISEEDISASLNNGILSINIPKKQIEKVEKKRIEIK